MEDGIIYTFGDVDALVVIFDGLRLLFDPATTTFFSGTGGLGLGVATTLAAVIALIGTMNQYVSQQRLELQGPLMGLFIYALVAIPTVDRMFISDVNTGKTLPVYDVPVGLGVLGYAMSLISYQTSELMETAFQTVAIEGTAFESTLTGGSGFLSPVKTLYALRTNSLPELDEHIVYNMYSYTKYCLYVATEGRLAANPNDPHFDPDELRRIASPFAYLTDVNHINPGYLDTLAEFMDPTTGEESFQRCEDIRNVLVADETSPGSMDYYLQSSAKYAVSRLRTLVSNNENAMQTCADGGTCVDTTTSINTAYELSGQLLGGTANAQNFYRLRVMRDFNALVSSAREIDPDSAMMAVANINESIQTTQLQEALEAETFINFMMPAMNFIIMLFYALFPLAMLIMITKGMGASQYLGGYLLIGIWGYSIIPVATAINYITIANTREAISALLNMEGFSSTGYEMMVNSAANYLSVGSNMLAAAPIVTLAIITGSVFALTSVASGAAAPSGGAGSVAQRASPQGHSQNTFLGLTPHMNDVQGSHSINPVQQRSAAAAETFKVSSAYNNSAGWSGVTTNTTSAKSELSAAVQSTTSRMTDAIRRDTAGTASTSEKAMVDGYQKIGQQFLREQGISLSGYEQSEARGIESAIGYVSSISGGIGGMLNLGFKNMAQAVEQVSGVKLTEPNTSNSEEAIRAGQTDASAPPGTRDNPTTSASPGKPGGHVGGGATANLSLSGALARIGSDRTIDTTTSGSSHSGQSSLTTGREGQVTTSEGVTTTNSGGVKLSSEEQTAVNEHQAKARQESMEYQQALEKQQQYADSAQRAQQFSQQHNFDLNDVYDHYNYGSVQAVKDHFDDMIEKGLRPLGFSDEQISAVQQDFHNDAESIRNSKVPGGHDALSYLVGGAYAADQTAFDYGRVAIDPNDPRNTSNLTQEQAKQAQQVLSNIDSKLFEPLLGSQARADMNEINSRLGEQKHRTAEASGVDSVVESQTGHINPASLGPQAPQRPLDRVNAFTDSLASEGKSGALLSNAIAPYFSNTELQSVIDQNAAKLGVAQGTQFGQLTESQQNQVLAEQMNTALKEVPGSLGIDASGYRGNIQHLQSGGVGQPDNGINAKTISGGSQVFRNLADGFNQDLDSRRGNIAGYEAELQQTDKNLNASNMSHYAFGASPNLLAAMSQHVPGAIDGDVRNDPGQIGGPNNSAPLQDRQNAWNTSLRAALGDEIAAGNLDENEANLIFGAHRIEPGSDVTPSAAYAGLTAGNVVGNFDTNKSALGQSVSGLVNFVTGTEEKVTGSTVERMSTNLSDSARSPMEALHAQRAALNMTPSENYQYLKSVRDGVEANGGDVSEFTNERLKRYADESSPATGNQSFLAGATNSQAGIDRRVENMVNQLPDNLPGRTVTSIIQSPLQEIQAQRGEQSTGTSAGIPTINISSGAGYFSQSPIK